MLASTLIGGYSNDTCNALAFSALGEVYVLGVSGTPLAADYDCDGLADFVVVDHTGAWYIYFSSVGYEMLGPIVWPR